MISRDSLTIMAYEYIKNEIVSLHFASGEPLPEERIAEKLNMSRSPVRRAIKLLESEGYVSIVRSKGATVTHITDDNINELCDLRILIEGWALEHSINSIPEERLDAVEEMFNLAYDHNSLEEHHSADRALHGLFIEYSNSLRVGKLVNTLESQTDWYKKKSDSITDIEHSRVEHLAIVEAVRAHDLEKAKQALESHLNRVRRTFLDAFND